ncbi:MAG TPA: hypothetical protein VGN72_09235 [Tepidisphaeraceae bacterium]|jgi:hypothetical protein|nr:hypothetical protein [Tepidisphaeraceae bacterium]
MIPNINDGSSAPPRLRCYLNGGGLANLPSFSTVPKGEGDALLQAIRAAGFDGMQGGDVVACRRLGLGIAGDGRVDSPADAFRIAADSKAKGLECATVHAGTGFESDAEIDRLVGAILEASAKEQFPIYLETHRATITQDIWRTVELVKRFPEIRFNGDFSHWYTGHEMVYGNLPKKLEFIQPVFDRVRFVHGRIGNPGSMQVDLGTQTYGPAVTPASGQPYIDHFRQMWTLSFAGFLKTAKPGDYLIFAPELLFSSIYYARLFPGPDGTLREEGDRWQQAQLYCRIARDCFEAARQTV